MKNFYSEFQRTARLWAAIVVSSAVITAAAPSYAELRVSQISNVKIVGPGIFDLVSASQGVTISPSSQRISFGVGTSDSAPTGGGITFDYQATLLGTGQARYGALSGSMVTFSSSKPDMNPFGLENEGRANAHGYEELYFADTGVVTSSTLALGSPVTLNFNVSLNSLGIFLGRPTAFNSEFRVDANYHGQVNDISPGATGSASSFIPGGGTHNFAFNTFVGNTLQIFGVLDLYNNVQAGRDYVGADYYGAVQGSIDASHTGRVVLSAPAGVGFVSSSGHDYTSAADPPPQALVQAAGFLTSIPGGSGNFTSLPGAPGYSSTGETAFYGTGSGGQQGIYRVLMQGPPIKVADLNTAIPGGSGNFTDFLVSGPPITPSIDGSKVAFFGAGSGGQQGVYVSVPSKPFLQGPPIRIADTSTAIPGGTGTFTSFTHSGTPPSPVISGSNVAFFGAGSGGQQGVYVLDYVAASGPPIKIADTATAIPGGAGTFTSIPQDPIISGDNVAFLGNGSGGQQGLYRAGITGPPIKVADLNTAIPGGSGNFTSFMGVGPPISPAIDGTSVAFFGAGSGGQQGIYVSQSGPPIKIADTATAIPGGSGNFTGFGNVSISATDVAFLGLGASGQQGIYDMTGGALLKVVDLAELVDGRAITGLNLSRSAVFGDPLAFQLTFADGSQALYTWSHPVLAGDFNADGKVDAADYLVWRKGLGTTYTQDDYSIWRAHFGQTAGSGSGATAAVPEPTTLVLLMFAAAGCCLRRRRTA